MKIVRKKTKMIRNTENEMKKIENMENDSKNQNNAMSFST